MLSRLLDPAGIQSAPVRWRGPASTRVAPPVGVETATDGAIERQLQQAHAAGIREGESRAKRDTEQRLVQLARESAASVGEIVGLRRQIIARAEADVVRLATEIARRILHREMSLDPDALAGLVKAALEKLGGQESYRVRTHPAQAGVIRRCLTELHGDATVDIVSDASQAEGCIVFETSQGALDASLETQLREIERGLADRLGDRG
jgi:flagellar assembly protein FliH